MPNQLTKYRRFLLPLGLILLFLILYGSLFVRGVVFYSADSYAFYFTQLRYWFGEFAANQAVAFWNPYTYLGTSFLYNTTNALFYPFHALGFILPPLVLYQSLWVIHLALLAWAVARWGKRAGATFENRALVTLLFAGAPFTSLFGTAGYNYLYAMTWATWLLSEIENPEGRSFVRLMIFWALLLFSGEPFTAIFLGAFLSYLFFFKGEKRQAFVFWAFSFLLGILIYGHGFLALAYSTRKTGLDPRIILSFGFHPLRLVTFLSPYFFGHPVHNSFRDTFVNSSPGVPRFLFDTPFLPSALFLLIVLGIHKSWREKAARPWLVGLVTAFVLSFGAWGPLRVLTRVPPFSMFRYPEKFTIVGILFALHFAFRKEDFLEEFKSPLVKFLLLAGIALSCVSRDNEWVITLCGIAFLAGLLAYERKKIAPFSFLTVIFLVGVVQCWWAKSPERTMPIAEIEKESAVGAYVKSVIGEKSFDRFEITPHVVRTDYPHTYLIYGTNMLFRRATIFGYDSFMTPFVYDSMKRLTGENTRFASVPSNVLKPETVSAFINLTSLKTLVVADDSPITSLMHSVREDAQVFRAAKKQNGWTALVPYHEPSALWWFSDLSATDPEADKLHWPPTVGKDRAFFRGIEWEWPSSKMAVRPPSCNLADPKQGERLDATSIQWTGDNEFRFKFKTRCPGWVFFSQTMLPGWRLFIDGKQEPLYRANGTFMAFQVGTGNVEGYLKYAPFQTLYEGFIGRFVRPL